MTEDWEQVTPFLQDMQHCTDDDYFSPQEVSVKALFGFGVFSIVFALFFHLHFFFNCCTYFKNAKYTTAMEFY